MHIPAKSNRHEVGSQCETSRIKTTLTKTGKQSMERLVEVFQSEMYYFERLAPFILAVKKMRPEIITNMRNMQAELVGIIEKNQEKLSSIYCSDAYELSLACMDIMSGLDEEILLAHYKEQHSTICEMAINKLSENLKTNKLHQNDSETNNIKKQIEKIKRNQKNYVKNQTRILNELTSGIKEKYHTTLKFPMPGRLRITDLLHEYDFIKIAAFYYYLKDHKRTVYEIQSDEIGIEEKIKKTKKHLFPISDNTHYIYIDGQYIKATPLTTPPDVFNHRRWRIDIPILSEGIGEPEESSTGYTLNIKTRIKIRENCKIDDAALLDSIKSAIVSHMYSHVLNDQIADPDKLLSMINLLSQKEEKKQEESDKHTSKLLNGYAIINLIENKTTIESAIDSMTKKFEQIYEAEHPSEFDALRRAYDYARDKIKKCKTWIDINDKKCI